MRVIWCLAHIALLAVALSGCGKIELKKSPTAGGPSGDAKSAISLKLNGQAATFSDSQVTCAYGAGTLTLTATTGNGTDTGKKFRVELIEMTPAGGTFPLAFPSRMVYSPDLSDPNVTYSAVVSGGNATLTIPTFSCDESSSSPQSVVVRGTFSGHLPAIAEGATPAALDVAEGSFTCVTTAIRCRR